MSPLLNGDNEKTLFCRRWNAYPQLLWIIMPHAFVRLPTSESTTFEQQVCSAKIGYANTILLGTNSRKKGMWTLRTAQIKQKKQCNFDSGWFERQELNQFHCYNLNRVFFSKGWTREFPSTRLVFEWKNGGGLRLLKCSMFWCWMLFFRMHACCITFTKMKSMGLCLS